MCCISSQKLAKLSDKIREMRAKRAKIFGYGGGPMAGWGGTQDFPDGGGQASMGGTRVRWGGIPPHTGKPCPPHVNVSNISAATDPIFIKLFL